MKGEKWTAVLFCGILAVSALLYAVLPKSDFSETEKRVLQSAPALTLSRVLDGSFEEDAEDWFSDHAPLRSALVSLNSHLALYTGQNGTEGYIRAGDRLFAAPADYDEDRLTANARAINSFAEEVDIPVTVMLIPESGYALEDQLPELHYTYHDAQAAALLRQELTVSFLFPEQELSSPEMYYRTDHHYTSLGAYTAARLFFGDLPEADSFTVETVEGFYGSVYSKAGLWEMAGESVELWRSDTAMQVTLEEKETYDSPFFLEHVDEIDKYPIFLDGNHAIVRIRTERTGGKKLLLIRDSFGHCFAPFAAESYDEVICVDLRYYKKSVSELARSEGIDEVLILYGMDTFLEDTNLPRLR